MNHPERVQENLTQLASSVLVFSFCNGLAPSCTWSHASSNGLAPSCNGLHAFCTWLAPSCNWLHAFATWLAPFCTWLHSFCNVGEGRLNNPV